MVKSMKCDNILLSIIIPVYNVETYIDKCLTMILNQVPEYGVEIVCIDDGSTDKSGIICEDYANRYSNLKVYHQENMGATYAKSKGLQLACGTYVAWCDSDDFYSVDWFKSVYPLLVTNQYDCIVTGYNRRFSKACEKHMLPFEGRISRERYIYYISSDNEIKSYLPMHIIKRDIIKHIKFNYQLITYEDYDFFTYVALKVKSIYLLNKSLYNYTYRENSITNTIKPQLLLSAIETAAKRCNVFHAEGLAFSYAGYWKTILIFCVKCSNDHQAINKYLFYKKYLQEHIWTMIQTKDLRLKDKLTSLILVAFPPRLIRRLWNIYASFK